MEKEKHDQKFQDIVDTHIKSVILTGHIYGWTLLLWATSGIAFFSVNSAMDKTSAASTIMYGLSSATSVGVCTFEINKILDKLKERKVYLKKFDELLDDYENEMPKIRRR